MSRLRPPLVLAAVLAVAGLLVPTASARAASLDELTGGSCADQKLEKPFLRFGDVADYVLAPDGTFEGGARGWKLTGGATPAAGNERFYLHGSRERRSLRLPAGSSATSPAVCVSLVHPTLRHVARNDAGATSTMNVEVLFADPLTGEQRALPLLPVASVPGEWLPTLPTPFLTNVATPLGESFRRVAFRFSVSQDGGAWTIDDVYVDPYRKG